ncbi:beta strand repeat-containing protein [Pseudomonadota bacterium]
MNYKKKSAVATSVALILGISTMQAHAATHVEVIDGATHLGVNGTITFDDWGFVGPNLRGATDFEPIPGGTAGQIQHVVTRAEDGLTPDAPVTVVQDLLSTPVYGSSDMDATVNFYHWAYTTKAGSTFNNMFVDSDGDYFVAQKDMSFIRYDTLEHNSALLPGDTDYYADGSYPTKIAFQPYVLSNAKGWCGSVLATNPGALEPMAGQIQFDFAFDVYFQTTPGVFTYSSTEIVKDFQMRSYGTITIDLENAGATDFQDMSASAVVNNTNPGINNLLVDGAPTDSAYYNLVSFMGAGVLDGSGRCGILNPNFVGGGGLTDTSNYKFTGLIDGIADAAACTTAGGTWQAHAYTGYAYILRADGIRVIEAMDYAEYPDLTNVPVVAGGIAYNNDENAVSQPIADITATPDAFSFTDQADINLDTQVTSNVITVTGLARDAVISISGGEYSINAGAYTSARSAVVNNDTVQLRATSASSANTTVDAVLTVGSVSDTFSVATFVAEDTTPDSFSFVDQSNLGLNTLATSAPITVAGINTATSISVAGGEYSINGNAFTSIAGTVNNGDTVRVRTTSSASWVTSVDATLTIGGVSGAFTVTTSLDTAPDQFSYYDRTGAQLNTLYTSTNSIGVSGIKVDAPISITGGEYSIDGGAWTSASGTISLFSRVFLRQTSASTGSTQTDAVLTIGGVSATFSVTTKATDTVPNQFSFYDRTGAELNKLYVSTNSIGVSGINAAAPISITGGEYSIDGGAFTSAPGTVSAFSRVFVRHTSAGTNSATVNTVLNIGGVSSTFSTTTKVGYAIDTAPNQFNFYDRTDAQLNRLYVSTNSIGVSGINADAPISVTGGEYSVNGGPWTSSPGTISLFSRVFLRHTSASTGATTVNTVLTIGTVSETFSTTTRATDTTPNQFSYYDRTDAQLNRLFNSTNSIQVSGTNAAAPISITGGEYSIDGGAWTSAPGTVNTFSRVLLRQTSSGTNNTQTDAVLTIGGISATFSITTKL